MSNDNRRIKTIGGKWPLLENAIRKHTFRVMKLKCNYLPVINVKEIRFYLCGCTSINIHITIHSVMHLFIYENICKCIYIYNYIYIYIYIFTKQAI